jgi:hypothetical protein
MPKQYVIKPKNKVVQTVKFKRVSNRVVMTKGPDLLPVEWYVKLLELLEDAEKANVQIFLLGHKSVIDQLPPQLDLQ